MESQRRSFYLGLACLVIVFLASLEVAEAAAMPSPGNYADMRSALKFLQDMDNFYSPIARPRYFFKLTSPFAKIGNFGRNNIRKIPFSSRTHGQL